MNSTTPSSADSKVNGVAIGVVTDNNDPDGLCRVRVGFPWLDANYESDWVRICTPMAGDNRGLVLIPEVDDEVLVAFERNDIRFPVVLGALWNGKATPPFPNSNGRNDERAFRSRKGHYLLFEDGIQGVVELAHEKGSKVRLDDGGVLVQGANGSQFHLDAATGSLSIEAAGSLTIKASSITLDATDTLNLRYAELNQ